MDNTTLSGATGELKVQTINMLKTEFKVNNMSELNWLQEIQITFTEERITQSQTTFNEMILNSVSIQDSKSVSIDIDSNNKFSSIEVEQSTDATAYQYIFVPLIYIVTRTRTDVSYTITYLFQFDSSPSVIHLAAAQSVLRSFH